jgi:hypothetical protein
MLSVGHKPFMMSVIMVNDIILNVVAPLKWRLAFSPNDYFASDWRTIYLSNIVTYV